MQRKRRTSSYARVRYSALRRKERHPRQIPLALSVALLGTTRGHTNLCTFDSDSQPIRIDNCASRSISNDKRDFIGPLVPAKGTIRGLTGAAARPYQGTIKWAITDDSGVRQDVLLPGSYYVPESPARLLSPQHWSQELLKTSEFGRAIVDNL